MIPRWLPLALSVVLLWLGVLQAQQPTPISLDAVHPNTAASINYDKMYEDIEILRRILDRKLTSFYPSETSSRTEGKRNLLVPLSIDFGFPTPYLNTQLFTPATRGDLGVVATPCMSVVTELVAIPIRSLEGVYLKGRGVIYTATLASLQPPARAEADSTAKVLFEVIAQQNSEWDSIRRQVRHEKEQPKKPETPKHPSLSDVLLKVLAENGHHFSQLPDSESLTLVLTVHDASPSAPAAKSAEGSAKKTESQLAVSGSYSGLIAEVRDTELLGELHLKQGKHEEAIKAFHYVLKRISDPKREAELHRKLAQCYLMQGQDEKARAELDQAVAIMKKETQAKETRNPSALPVKLIISAPKKLLDQMKTGKITFEEFRRQAQVETLRFGDHR